MIELIKRNFIHVDSRTFVMLCKALVRPRVEYANSIGSPYKKRDIEAIEKVQKRATKLVISLEKLPYRERLLQLNLHTLKYRRLRGDMIEVYKITHDMYDRSVALELPRNLVLEVININCKTTAFITTFENFLLLHEQLTCGTVYRTM